MPLPVPVRTYLRQVGMTDPLIQRSTEVYEFYRRLVQAPIPGFFVSEYITEDGRREYESFWLFTPRLAMEAKSFLTGDNFDIAPLYRHLVYVQISKQSYDFVNADPASRLTVYSKDTSDNVYTLRASGTNCDKLRDIVKGFLLQNLNQ